MLRAVAYNAAASRRRAVAAPACFAVRRWLSAEVVDKSLAARQEINQLWKQQPALSSPIGNVVRGRDESAVFSSSDAARELMDKYQIRADVAREEDVTTAMGEAFDRLLLLLVPFKNQDDVAYFERLLQVAARNGNELSIRTIQHVFARVQNYAEALSVFHAMRKCGVRMNMHAYYAMCFCLQRIEEESWALKIREDVTKSGQVDQQAMQFILDGCPNQLLPENKPYLGRIVFADADPESATTNGAEADFDALGKQWAQRYQ